MKPLVSVIIPTYNRNVWVQEAIDSVLAQDFHDFELILVDDGSQDETAAQVKRKPGLQGYLYVKHGGVSRARNLGVRVARGEWLSFLDSDDLWLPQKLRRQMEYLSGHPECSLCYTDEIWIRHGVRVNPMKKHQKYSGWIFQQCLPLCLISPSSVLFHRSLLEKVGGFDESLRVCEDYDLWLRITSQYPVAFLEEKLIIKRGGHPDQLSHSEWGLDRYRIGAIQKLLWQSRLTPPMEIAALQELARKCKIVLQGCLKRERFSEAADYERYLAEAEQRLQLMQPEPEGKNG